MNHTDHNGITHMSLHPLAARRLSDTTKTRPMMESITPRWFLDFLLWVPVQAGIYRVNRIKRILDANEPVNDYGEKLIEAKHTPIDEDWITETYPDYEEQPDEYMLSVVQTILRLNTNVADIFNCPYNQKDEQVRLTIEAMRERQEWEMINNPEYGLLHVARRICG